MSIWRFIDIKLPNNPDSERKIENKKPLNEQDGDSNVIPVNIQYTSDENGITKNDIKYISFPTFQKPSEKVKTEQDYKKELDKENNDKEDEKDSTLQTAKKNKPNRKQKLVGDIHINQQHLKDFGADLWRAMFSFFNESIKVRKLNYLRKWSKYIS